MLTTSMGVNRLELDMIERGKGKGETIRTRRKTIRVIKLGFISRRKVKGYPMGAGKVSGVGISNKRTRKGKRVNVR